MSKRAHGTSLLTEKQFHDRKWIAGGIKYAIEIEQVSCCDRQYTSDYNRLECLTTPAKTKINPRRKGKADDHKKKYVKEPENIHHTLSKRTK